MSTIARCLVAVVIFLFAVTISRADSAIDPAKGTPDAEGKSVWFNVCDIGIEGQGWGGLENPFDRLPPEAKGNVPDAVWNLSHDSAGLSVRFVTDSDTIAARWSLRDGSLSMPHMPSTGVSGLDLYVKRDGAWGWIAMGKPSKKDGNEQVLVNNPPAGPHEYLLYLPLYNGIASLEIGVKPGAKLAKGPDWPEGHAKPMLFWGTSILQGGCASRPGMAYPSIIGRRMLRPVVNLGFSGNGRMDPGLVPIIAKADASVYVIDCAPNMQPALITERAEPLVKTLREARPDTPIVLVENVPYQQGWFLAKNRESYENKNAALKAAYDRLIAAGVKNLHYIPCNDLFGHDHEATVDGTHATDLGFMRMADAIEPVLRKIMKRH